MIDDRTATPTGENETYSPLRVLDVQVYRGPNTYTYDQVIRIDFSAGALAALSPADLRALAGRCAEELSSMNADVVEHFTDVDSVSFQQLVELVAVNVQRLAGIKVGRFSPRPTREPRDTDVVMFRYQEERIGKLAGLIALRVINHLLPPHLHGLHGLHRLQPTDLPTSITPDTPLNLTSDLDELRRLVRRHALGPTTRSLVDEAERRGIPHLRLDEASLVQLGYGKYQQQIRASITGQTNQIATEIASNKDLTKKLLDRVGLPTPQGEVVRTPNDAIRAARRVGYPVVVKPLDGNHGRGVTLNLTTDDAVRHAYTEARQHSRAVLVEQYYTGNDHRILVINGEVIAVAERIPAHVTGDGSRTIQQLVDHINQDPRRGDGHENVMTRIIIDQHVIDFLARTGRSPVSIPDAGEVVYLRDTANMSTGGTAIDHTDDIHPDNRTIARRAAKAIGLDIAGIDLITPDITRSVHDVGGGIVEVNAAPGFRMHLQPSEGKGRNVAAPVLDMLFPKGTPCRMPIISITGTNGKSTTSRMVAHIMKHAGFIVGLTTSNGIYIDGELIVSGDTTGPRSAKVVLSDPNVELAVLETARGGILREGLGFDRCDVGAVLNIQPDHLGLKGIETLDDLAWVKSLVVEVVTDTGVSVLNADDPLTLAMRDRAKGRIAWFSMNGGDAAPAELRAHIAEGGLALVREGTVLGDELVMYEGGQRLPIIRARDIPATLGGFAKVNVQNALAAAAIAVAREVPLPVLRSALSTFSTSFEQSPGRLNLFDGHPFRVLMDYAHNPSGLGYLGELVRHLRPERGRVIGVIGVAGDRRDEDMREMGALAAGAFDEVIVREDELRRGRAVGVGAQLVVEGALAVGFAREHLRVILSEREAVDAALRAARQGDLVVVLVTDVEERWQQIRDFDSSNTPPRDFQSDRQDSRESHRA